MLRRIAVVAAVCAATLPFATGSASASCLDDFRADALRTDAEWYPSDHYLNWVHVEGTATVIVEGDALIYDVPELLRVWLETGTDYSESTSTAATAFVDCVAG